MNLETNTVPWSEMTTCSIPCLAYTSSHRIFAHPSDESSVEHAIGMISLEKMVDNHNDSIIVVTDR